MPTPIEDILIEKPRLKSLAKRLCWLHSITTAEQLAAYNMSAFRTGGNFRTVVIKTIYREKTMSYLEECLRNVGMSFSRESSQGKGKPSNSKIYGKENTKNDLLTAMKKIGKYAPRGRISRLAEKTLAQELEPWEEYNGKRLYSTWGFVTSVFDSVTTNPLFEELVEEGKVEKIETAKGFFYRINTKDS